ncbi:hypothetical protein Mmc1_1114 [Magnetococcus marinus MC-1]|uniref:Surface lipoprotein assembly modifier C-terminal domain-containing protein n=1 Tax=Magnetococcus marinus (strain ATCC BAA-1437 / JCM 17883 / MC-1) TaxID=156889 RepID=A0L6N8_MAGMM|nr:surface lipoprotein assembly modifier [Magnetococcus marinus]ABK43631.1 hypothetical protein Mmc1_1114 [Magnetococcus marinus MC-1]
MFKYHPLLVCALLSLLFMGERAAHAADAEPMLTQARQALADGHAQQARILLEPLMVQQAGNPDYDYLLGLVYQKLGLNSEAQFALERVIMVDANHHGARLALAEIYQQIGESALARAQIQPIPLEQLSIKDQQRAVSLMQQPKPSQKIFELSGYLSATVGLDSNVSTGPDATDLYLPALGTSYTLGNAADFHDWSQIYSAGLQGSWKLNEQTWLMARGQVAKQNNQRRDDLDSAYTNAQLGILYKQGDNRYAGMLLNQFYWVAEDLYRYYWGGQLNWERTLGSSDKLNSYVQYLNYTLPNNVDEETAQALVGLTYSHRFGKGERVSSLYGDFNIGKAWSFEDQYDDQSHRILGASLGGEVPIGKASQLSGLFSIERSDYDAVETIYYQRREDQLATLQVWFEHPLGHGFSLLPLFSYSSNRSNLPLYTYARYQGNFSIQWSF